MTRHPFLNSGDDLIDRCAPNGALAGFNIGKQSEGNTVPRGTLFASRVRDARAMILAGVPRAVIRQKHGGVVLRFAENGN